MRIKLLILFIILAPTFAVADAKIPSGFYRGTAKLKRTTFSCSADFCPPSLPVDIGIYKSGSTYVYRISEGDFIMTSKRLSGLRVLYTSLPLLTQSFATGETCNYLREVVMQRDSKKRVLFAYGYKIACNNGFSGFLGYAAKLKRY